MMSYLKRFRQTAAFLCLVAGTTALAEDPRRVWDGGGPAWLVAVGKLTVHGVRIEDGYPRHLIEDCSATLVRAAGDASADLIVTAWHCLAYYRDLSKPILFTPGGGQAISRQRSARRLADGGGMHADWAILRLDRPLPGELAIVIAGATATRPGDSLVMAGFSGDAGKGDSGRRLTYHSDCRQTSGGAGVVHTDCLAFKGASGGGVFLASTAGAADLVGVVSGGDGETTSTYVPLARFRENLDRFLAATTPRPAP